jgi:type I restriction enzyme, S subunit
LKSFILKSKVPYLRFPEFRDEWNETTLRKVSTNISYGIGASAVEYDGKNKYLRITDIDEDSHQFVPKPLCSPQGRDFNNYRLISGDIVFARTGASVGKSYLYKEDDGNLVYAGFLIKFHIQKADPYFIYLLTYRSTYNKWVLVHSMRSGQPGLNAEEYKEFAFFKPSVPEQQKIATFLSAVDKKIQLLQRKKELLEQYKKGVMQKIFSQEIRFKDEKGQDYPDWEEKKIGAIFKIKAGGDIDSQHVSKDSSSIFKYPIYANSEKRFGLYGYSDIFKIDHPSITVTGRGSLGIAHARDHNYYPIVRLLVLLPKLDQSIWFFQYAISMLNIFVESTGVPQLTAPQISSYPISFPSHSEQETIASYLRAVDKKIHHVQLQAERVQIFKKGLLQQMFV